MEFKATQMSIEDCFRLKRKYVIPRFQREYSWENDELMTIWDDLLDNLTFDGENLNVHEYFIGSLVLVGDEDISSKTERYIVDGQQRLMTFTIAFSVLTQIFDKEGDIKLSNATFTNIMSEDSDGNLYAKLVAENPKPFFQLRVQQKTQDLKIKPKNQEEINILNAIQFFEKHLESKCFITELESRFTGINNKISYIEALKIFRNQILVCKVVYVTVKSFEDAYTIFEVLNAKGKDLTALDIIKNSIFSILKTSEPLDLASEKWKQIRIYIAKCNEDLMTFYRHFWLSKYSFTTAKNLVKDFQNFIQKNEKSYIDFLNSLEAESAVYSSIVMPIESEWTQPEDIQVFISLDALSIFNTSQVRTFLLALFDAKKALIINHRKYIEVLRFLEHFHFIFTAVCSSRASGLERRYSSYARKLRSCKTKIETALCIDELIKALKDTLPSYEVFESKFLDIQYTSDKPRNKRLVQYILKKLETYFSKTKELKPSSFTIEHIIPESTKKPYVGQIGNLLPLGEQLNGKLSDKTFDKKLSYYPESQYTSVNNFLNQYSQHKQFTQNDVLNRTKSLSLILYNEIK